MATFQEAMDQFAATLLELKWQVEHARHHVEIGELTSFYLHVTSALEQCLALCYDGIHVFWVLHGGGVSDAQIFDACWRELERRA